jgi:hypothetical protein
MQPDRKVKGDTSVTGAEMTCSERFRHALGNALGICRCHFGACRSDLAAQKVSRVRRSINDFTKHQQRLAPDKLR